MYYITLKSRIFRLDFCCRERGSVGSESYFSWSDRITAVMWFTVTSYSINQCLMFSENNLSIYPSVHIYFMWCNDCSLFVLIGGIAMILAANIHHVIRNCCKRFQGQRWNWCVQICQQYCVILMVLRRGSLVSIIFIFYLKSVSSRLCDDTTCVLSGFCWWCWKLGSVICLWVPADVWWTNEPVDSNEQGWTWQRFAGRCSYVLCYSLRQCWLVA